MVHGFISFGTKTKFQQFLEFLVISILINNNEIAGITTPLSTLNYSLIDPEIKNSDVILGSLFPIHEKGPDQRSDICGKLQGEDGILPLEALLFSLDQVNSDKTLLPNITLGVLSLDSCNSEAVALQQSLKFIKGFIASHNTHHDTEFVCTDKSTPIYQKGNYDKIAGVIGGQYSSVSIQIANVLRLFKVPQISYRSTSSSLSERGKYPYFLRTVPTDNNQAEVILKVLKQYNVTYVSLVYSKTDYGFGGLNELLKKASKFSVCFASPTHGINIDDNDEEFKKVASVLMKRKRAQVIILFAELTTSVKLFKQIKKDSKFIWIGSDGWTSHTRELDKYGDILEGSIGIQPLTRKLVGFKEYFTKLTPENNARNPWFREYWEDHFNCSFTEERCQNYSLKTSKKYVEVEWLHFVRDSVYAFAHGLHNMWLDKCVNKTSGLCDAMIPHGHVHGHELYEYLRKVQFLDVANDTFEFQKSGAGTPRYTVLIFRKDRIHDNPWISMAKFTSNEGVSELEYLTNQSVTFPISVCGVPCGPRKAKIIDQEDTCCWRCDSCGDYQFLNETTSVCHNCNNCQMPNPSGLGCINKTEMYLDYRNQWAITSMAFATLGIFSTIFVGIIFTVHLDTPVIRAASRELSYILLAGILMSFCMTFAILAPPSPFSCGFSRFFLGFSHTLCYSAILTKTNRISRIFNKNPAKSQVKTRYTSPRSQLVIVLLLVCVEVIINLAWLVYYRPEEKEICSRDIKHKVLICKGIDDISYIVGFIYPLFLVCLCTIYAIKTRKCPGGFNEARYIAFTNYTTCIIWLVFVPLYLTTPAKDGIRIVSLSMSLSLGGFVQLGCLFFPKVHIVLFKPEKNTRDAVMSQPRGSSIIAAGVPNSAPRSHSHSSTAMVYINGTPSYPVVTSPVMLKNGEPKDDSTSQKTLTLGKTNPIYLSSKTEHNIRQ